jgi:hypothetical protein
VGSLKEEDGGPNGPRHKAHPYHKNNQNKKDQQSGSSGRTPAYQVQSPEFKPQSYSKKPSIEIPHDAANSFKCTCLREMKTYIHIF